MDGTAVEVVERRTVGPDSVALTLASPGGFDARPGQFVQVRAPVDGESITRHYSISSPTTTETFEITVGVDPDGTLSPWLAGVDPGATLAVDGPFGRVYYDDESSVVILVAGPGVGPAVGVAERTLRDGGDAAIVYRADELVHGRRLARLAAAGALVHVVSDHSSLEAAVAATVDRGRTFVYGFEPFVEDARAAIEEAGGDPDAAKVENFG